MNEQDFEYVKEWMGRHFKAHPWHGVPIGVDAPHIVTAYVEIVPTDAVKYELDKTTGHLTVDRPQRFSNVCPTIYGLIPQTCCGERVAARCAHRTDHTDIVGDNDPLDICILAEKAISHGDLLLQAIPIGGLRMIDGQEADDKIVAVMKGDAVYEQWQDISHCSPSLIDRLKHYFLTYKERPGCETRHCEIAEVYGREEAYEVIRRSQEDYRRQFPAQAPLLMTTELQD